MIQSVQPDHAIVQKQLYFAESVLKSRTEIRRAASFENRKEALRISSQKRIVRCLVEPIKAGCSFTKPLMMARVILLTVEKEPN